MKRFVAGESRPQATFFLELLDDFVTEDNPVQAMRLSWTPSTSSSWISTVLIPMHGPARQSPRYASKNLSLWLPQSRAIQPPFGT